MSGLRDFRRQLCERTVRDRPINIKTVRNVIDWHFRALYRDAREELEEQGVVLGDPFTRLRWQKTIREKPDPFTPEERDIILEYFREKRPTWYPLIHTLFFTGARPGELAALRLDDVDLDRGTISITKSRDEHAEAAPKTEKSRREIPLLPNVVEVLRLVQRPPDAGPDTYFFRNPDGGPVTTTWWPKKSWFPVLKRVGVPSHIHLLGAHPRDEFEGHRRVCRHLGRDGRELVWPLHFRPRPRATDARGRRGAR